MGDLELVIAEVEDPVVRENFDRLQKLSDEDLFSKFIGKHVEISRVANGTYLYLHNFGFRPRDVIQTSVITEGVGTFKWNYGSFDRTNVSFTVAGLVAGETVTVRAFIGSYAED